MNKKLVTAEQAQQMIDDAEAGPWDFAADYGQVACRYGVVASGVDDHNAMLIQSAPALATTIIAQAEQIERLQRAFETALSEINDLNEETYNHMAGTFRPQGTSDYGITAEDMEDTDE